MMASLQLGERLPKASNQVFGGLEAGGEADKTVGNAHLGAHLGRDVVVRHAGRMLDKACQVAQAHSDLVYSPPLITAITSVTQMCRRNGEFGFNCKLGPLDF